MNRRWQSGWQGQVDGLWFRVVKGKKHPDDLKLECHIGGIWQPVKMELALFLTDFFYENEDVLYPPPAKGGQYFLDYVRHAAKQGWEKTAAGIRAAREIKRNRPTLFEDGVS